MPSSIRSTPERRQAWGALVVALGLAVSPPVYAARAGAPTALETRARAKFSEGNAAYEKSDFQRALDAYGEAYQLAPLPGFLFNIAQCYRQLNQPEPAATFYRRYLAQSKQPPANAPLVRELIAEMDTAVGAPRQETSALRKQTAEVAERRALQDGEHARTVSAVSGATSQIQGESLARKWWVWAGAGALALAAGGIAYAATAPQPRPTTLGTMH